MSHMRTTLRQLAGVLAVGLAVAGLTGCSLLMPQTSEPDTTILFSHSAPVAAVDAILARGPSTQWSAPSVKEVARLPEVEKAPAPVADLEVYFALDSDELRSDDKTRIDEWLQTIDTQPLAKILISGHTDITYTREHNAGLSMRRAQVVARYLSDHGIERQRMRIDAHGPDQPKDTNTTEEGRARNRRTQVSLDLQP